MSPFRKHACILVGATLLSYLIGYAVGSRILLPILNTLPAYGLLVLWVRRGERGRAVGLMLLWALSLALFGTLAAGLAPERAEAVVLNGARYRDGMIHWVRTGEGEEGRPREFLPRHLKELAAYVPIALVTAGAGAMLMGAVLMNFMDCFVAGLALQTESPWLVGFLAWFPWSILRVVGYVILGVVLSEPLLSRLKGSRPPPSGRLRYLVFAAACLLADVAVKSLLAPSWGRMLATMLISQS